MDNLIYYLKNVSCKYKNSDHSVLEIDSLSILRGNVVFFVGASGVGKSTLLETLGLMTKTVLAKEDCTFHYFSSEGVTENLLSLWKKKESYISNFRRDHLSFVFQNINMFNNLSALENICLAQIIQGEKHETSRHQAKVISKELFDTKTFKEIVLGKKITNFSGGQKQRLAFVRAGSTNSPVLLADEPTGNLDTRNADNLMSELVRIVKNEKKTAIIVTHDIPLAMKYGDQLVLLQKKYLDKDKMIGTITSDKTFISHGENWENVDGIQFSNDEMTELLWKGLE
tara:strand:- start:4669 stop:5520 length:852 start_codon:yes stop_codon:yes gene_type:complete